jgi:hypothetical protein
VFDERVTLESNHFSQQPLQTESTDRKMTVKADFQQQKSIIGDIP